MSKPEMRILGQKLHLFGEFTLDTARAQLLREGQEVKLRPKSYDVLKYLIENPGRIITKEEVIQTVWSDSFVTDDSLVQCLRDVRRALGDESQRYIRTVPRRGYIFEAELTTQNAPGDEVIFAERIEGVRLVIEERNGEDAKPGVAKVERSRTHNTGVTRLGDNRWLRPVGLLIIGVIVVSSYLVVSNRKSARDAGAANPVVRSIAVLPFKAIGQDQGDQDLGIGIADTLITRLSGIGGLIVRPTSTVQKYTSRYQDSIAAGSEQLVDAVLEGSIQRSGDTLRVTVRLIRVRDGSPLWAYKYDGRSAEVFAVQDAISQKVAEALRLKLGGEERRRLAKQPTENIEAYQLYARAVFLRNQMTKEGLSRSIECFQKAIELDPEYAMAYAGQASSISPMAWFGYMSSKDVKARNSVLIRKALDLDDTLAEAHAAAAELKLFFDWDWEGAEREFKRALELNPNEQLSHLLYPDLLLIMGRQAEAIAIAQASVEIDPISPRAGKAAADICYLAGQYDRALEQFNRIRELFPNYSLINAGPCYEQKGIYDRAVQEYLESESRWGMREEGIVALRLAYAAQGWRGYWQKRLELARAEATRRPMQSVYFAVLHARLGENDQAFELLEKAYEERQPSLIFLDIDPKWGRLRSDQRFQSLLRRIGLKE